VTHDEHSLVLKYFDLLDEFVRVRVLQDLEFSEVLDGPLRNKSEYRQTVITSCLPDYDTVIADKLRILEDDYDPLTIEDLLYQLCIDVNPGFEIHQVCIPCHEDKKEDASKEATHRGGHPAIPWKIQTLDKALGRRIIGQDEAIKRLSKAMQKNAIGLKRPNQPVGTFFLVGRTGTGKTEIAKVLTRALHNDLGQLVRIDCSEYALPHEYAKLIGSPPGYIGHSEGGFLTEAVKAKPECVVLFDEIEKAHEKVHNLLLQILDEGLLTDSKGETVSFRQTIILLTSNLGVETIDRVRGRMGFDLARRQSLHDINHVDLTKEALKESFRPEFLNRIDETIIFQPLDVEVCTRIAGNMMRDIGELLEKRGYHLRFSNGLRRHLAEEGFSEEYGARELTRLIKHQVEDLIAERILEERLMPGTRLFVRMRGGKVVLETEESVQELQPS
jgi:ATP-dependent Clp protease ATP-binding subunit ClpC